MARERHAFTIRNPKPPKVEWDLDADAVYVRFSNQPVARTIDQNSKKMIVTVDLDAKDQVVGIEGIGMTRFSFTRILEAANVKAPKVDFSAAEIALTKA